MSTGPVHFRITVTSRFNPTKSRSAWTACGLSTADVTMHNLPLTTDVQENVTCEHCVTGLAARVQLALLNYEGHVCDGSPCNICGATYG